MGLLTGGPIPAWHPAPHCVREAAEAVRLACQRYDVNPGTLGLSFCLKHDVVASTLVGISSEAEMEAACVALEWTPPEPLLQAIRNIVEPVQNVLWPSGREINQDTSVIPGSTCDVSH